METTSGDPGRELILVVDDDATVREVVVGYLRAAGFDTCEAVDGPNALEKVRAAKPHLLVLDLNLPGMDGLEVFRRLRADIGATPVVMLTARGEEPDRVLGFEIGADDYVTKPFSPRELVLRVRSVLRRTTATIHTKEHTGQEARAGHGPDGGPADSGISPGPGCAATTPMREIRRDGDLVVDVTARRATRGRTTLTLTMREFDLLAHLVAHPGVAFSREELMRQVWGWEHGDQSTVTVHVRRLREKIETGPRPTRLVTVWGVGYRWDCAPQASEGDPGAGAA
ncbi:response regulator transcription factor [Austwickia chelonae]|uniref:response regulator transcription factor n=1 Tax=Austwickia chelonae TaxID=100225 RepID=UPI001F08365A|nr:response regulator transcription factor [Austwickia chelonae]